MKVAKRAKKTYAEMKWKPQCALCQYCKKNKEFRERLFNSTYFNSEGTETSMKVNRSYGKPFTEAAVYTCLKRHHSQDLVREPSKIIDGKLVIDRRMKPTFDVVEVLPGQPTTDHELGLDEFIKAGRAKLNRGELAITANTYLQAIRTKMDNDAKTKDRRADMLQGLFKGAAPKHDV